jgi:hypothetical protein
MLFLILKSEGEYDSYVENVTHIFSVPKGMLVEKEYLKFLCSLYNKINPKKYFVNQRDDRVFIDVRNRDKVKGEEKSVIKIRGEWPIEKWLSKKKKIKQLQFQQYLD